MINPMKLDPTAESYGYRYYAGVLGAFVALSVAGNMAFFMVPEIPTPVVALSHGMPPVIFALMVHMGPTLRSSFAGSVRRPGPRARRERGHIDWGSLALLTVLGVAVATVAVIALIVSFSGLEGLAAAMGWGRWSWTLPVLIDVPAGAATIGVMAAASAMKADAAVVDRVTSSTDEVVTPDELGDELPIEAPSTAGQKWSVVGNSTVRRVTDEFEDAGDELTDELVTSGDELGVEVVTNSSPASRHPAELGVQGDELVDTPDELGDEMPIEAPSSAGQKWSVDGNSSLPTSYRRVADELDTPSDELGDEPDELADTSDELRLARAAELVATTKINATPDELATVLALDEEGASKVAIAEAVGRSRSTVTGWLKAAADDAEEISPALTVVNGR